MATLRPHDTGVRPGTGAAGREEAALRGPPVGPVGRWIRRPVPEEQLAREVDRLRGRRHDG